jgi:hypothetical protein
MGNSGSTMPKPNKSMKTVKKMTNSGALAEAAGWDIASRVLFVDEGYLRRPA